MAAVQAIQLDFEGHAEVKRYGGREVCWFYEAARPVDALASRGSGRLIQTCHSSAHCGH